MLEVVLNMETAYSYSYFSIYLLEHFPVNNFFRGSNCRPDGFEDVFLAENLDVLSLVRKFVLNLTQLVFAHLVYPVDHVLCLLFVAP